MTNPWPGSCWSDTLPNVSGLTLVKSAENSIDAFTVIQNRPVDLIFLDIQMPQITGIELLQSLKQRPRVILTTAVNMPSKRTTSMWWTTCY